MKKGVYILFFVSILVGCQNNTIINEKTETKKNDLGGLIENTPETITSLEKYIERNTIIPLLSINEVDSLQAFDLLKVFEYQNLTGWGGLTLYYFKERLVKVMATHNSEFDSFSNYYFFTNKNNKLSKVINNQMFNNVSANIFIDSNGVLVYDKSLNEKLVQKAIIDANSLFAYIQENEEEMIRDSKLKE